MTVSPPVRVATRRRWAIRLIVKALVAPNSVSHDERAAVAGWLAAVARGGELRHFDLDAELRRRGISTATFAAQVGVKGRIVRYWRRGERTPSREIALRIGNVLGIETARILTMFVMMQDGTRATLPYDPSLPLIGRNLAAARQLCKLTQRQLSAITGVPRVDISHSESESKSPATGLALLEIQYAIANRLRRRGYRTLEKFDRTRGRVRYYVPDPTGQEAAPAASD